MLVIEGEFTRRIKTVAFSDELKRSNGFISSLLDEQLDKNAHLPELR